MNETMRIYEEETGAENTRILFGQDKLWKYIDWLEARCKRLFTESEKAKIAFHLLKKTVDDMYGTESYNTVMWDEKKELFVLTITDNSGVPFKIRITEEDIAQLMQDVTRDYYRRHDEKMFGNDETIYVIEYSDIAGSGIDYITTKKWNAVDRWEMITKIERFNPILLTYSEYHNGIRKVIDRWDSQKGKK
jgi:hypothetical protein